MRRDISCTVLSINTVKPSHRILMIQPPTSIVRVSCSKWVASTKLRTTPVTNEEIYNGCNFFRLGTNIDSALNLLADAQSNSSLLLYYVCLQRAEVLYADGEFELGSTILYLTFVPVYVHSSVALMYFHRANKIKPAQQTCLEGIQKATEILECTICNPTVHLTITNNLMHPKGKPRPKANLLSRPPIRKRLPSSEIPLTEYTNKEANRLLVEVAKDRRLLLDLYGDNQSSAGLCDHLAVLELLTLGHRLHGFGQSKDGGAASDFDR